MDYFNLFGPNKVNMAELYPRDGLVRKRTIQLTMLSRVFIAVLIFQSIVILATGEMLFDHWAKIFTIPVVGITIAVLTLACRFFETGREFVGRIVLISVVYLSCVSTVILCGGFLNSSATPMLVFPMILAFCTLSIPHARMVFFASIFVPLAIDITTRWLGVELPNFSAQTNPLLINLNILATLFVSMYFCLFYLKNARREPENNTPI